MRRLVVFQGNSVTYKQPTDAVMHAGILKRGLPIWYRQLPFIVPLSDGVYAFVSPISYSVIASMYALRQC